MVASVFPTVDGGFGCIIVTSPTEAIPDSVFLRPRWMVYVTYLRPDSDVPTDPIVVYQTTSELEDVQIQECNASYDGSGQSCVLTVLGGKKGNRQYLKVTFLSNGGAFPATVFELPNRRITVERIHPLYYGGYLVTGSTDGRFKRGFVINEDGKFNTTWGFGPREVTRYNRWARNNTVFYASTTNDSWSVTSDYLPVFKSK
jgi:hypothetical protein